MAGKDDFIGQLGQGVERFRSRVFPARRALFEKLARAQRPRALFITCADSRIVPSLITHTGPGDLFIERNPGNIVPVYSGASVGVSASIEYAVAALGVEHVVVCGHTDCGAVKGILHPEKVADLPAVGRWLEYGAAARKRVEAALPGADDEVAIARLTEENVRVQMENLDTHPSVRAARAAGRLTVEGWVYRIESGEVWALDPAAGHFILWPEFGRPSAGSGYMGV